MVSKNLKGFQEKGGLPNLLKHHCQKYPTVEELYEVFLKEKTVFHKKCMSSYDNQKLARKRKISQVNESGASQLEPADNNAADMEARRRSKRKRVEKVLNKNCLFCGEVSKDMHCCQTLELHQKIKDIGTEMCDNKVLGELSQGNMVATDADCHLKCLVDYKNKYCSFNISGKVIK